MLLFYSFCGVFMFHVQEVSWIMSMLKYLLIWWRMGWCWEQTQELPPVRWSLTRCARRSTTLLQISSTSTEWCIFLPRKYEFTFSFWVLVVPQLISVILLSLLQLLWGRYGSRHTEDHRSSVVQPDHLLSEQRQEASCGHGRQHTAGHAVQVSVHFMEFYLKFK